MGEFLEAQTRMWALVQQFTDQVGYERGAKAAGLFSAPPVIDCSGWVAFLLREALQAENAASGKRIFDPTIFDVESPWSDRIILDIEAAGSNVLEGAEITAGNLPRYATIGLNEGHAGWESNRPRTRGINHIVQIVRRPSDDAVFVSESYGAAPAGIRISAIGDWLIRWQSEIATGNAWAVDPFAPINLDH